MTLRNGRSTIIALIVGLFLFLAAILVSTKFTGDATSAQSLQSATSLSVDHCTEVEDGETVELEVHVNRIAELIAWEIYFAYDSSLLEVINRDVRQFLSEGPNSNVFDLSDPVPNSTGLYRLAAADVALDAVAETGSGVITTVTLRARNEGVSPAAIYRSDILPLGPRLTGEGGTTIGDTNGDGIFDGTITSGQIAIDRPCRPTPPTPNPDIEDIVVVPTPNDPAATGRPTADPSDPPEETSAAEPTDGSDGTQDPNGESPAPGDGTPSPVETDDDDSDQSPTPTRTERPGGRNDGGDGIGGIGSGGGNTFWAIVLIGGGVTLGLVATYFFARMTRKPV